MLATHVWIQLFAFLDFPTLFALAFTCHEVWSALQTSERPRDLIWKVKARGKTQVLYTIINAVTHRQHMVTIARDGYFTPLIYHNKKYPMWVKNSTNDQYQRKLLRWHGRGTACVVLFYDDPVPLHWEFHVGSQVIWRHRSTRARQLHVIDFFKIIGYPFPTSALGYLYVEIHVSHVPDRQREYWKAIGTKHAELTNAYGWTAKEVCFKMPDGRTFRMQYGLGGIDNYVHT